MTDLDRAAEYAAAAEAWRAFCARGTVHKSTSGEPIAVVLLAGLCEPGPLADSFTGDPIVDMLVGLAAFVQRLANRAADGGGGGLWIDTSAIEVWQRRLDTVITLRLYEQAHREHLTRKLAGSGGAP